MTVHEKKVHTRDKVIDWATYAILSAGMGWMISNQTKALDMINAQANTLSSLGTWARIVAQHLGIPY